MALVQLGIRKGVHVLRNVPFVVGLSLMLSCVTFVEVSFDKGKAFGPTSHADVMLKHSDDGEREHPSATYALSTQPSRTTCDVEPSLPGLQYNCTQPYLEIGTPRRLDSPVENVTVPLVAHCVAGLSRTFTEPLVCKSFKHNFVDAFGGRVVLFMMLKSFDVANTHANT